jgi:hypothetical protein
MHHSFYSYPRTFNTVLMEKSNDSEVIEFLSELEISSDSNEEVTSPQKVSIGAGPYKKDNETACGSLEESKETSSDEVFRNSFFSFIFKDESPTVSFNDGSPLKLEFLDKRFSHQDRSNTRQKALSWFSHLFACQGEMEGCLTGALVTDAEGCIIDKQSILRESAFHSVFESLSNKSCSIGKQEKIDNDYGRNVLDNAVDNLKEFCSLQNNEEFSLEKIVAFSPSSGCSCLEQRGNSVVTDANTLYEERIVNQAPIMLLEGERHTLLGISQPEAHILAPQKKEVIEKTQDEISGLKQVECNSEEKLTVFEEKHCHEEMTLPANHNFETIFVKIRLRKMEADLIKERNAKAEKQEEYDLLLTRIAELERERNEAQKLISSLKSDLHVAVVSTSTNEILLSTSAVSNEQSHNESAPPPRILISDEGISEPSISRQAQWEPAKSTSEKSTDDHTVDTAMVAQLDQLRARCDMLEEMRESLQQDLEEQIHGAELLKKVNAELYEKVRCQQPLSKICSDETASNDADLNFETLEGLHEVGSEVVSVAKREHHEAGSKISLVAKHLRNIFFRCMVGTLLLVLFTILQWYYDQEERGEDFFCGYDDIEVHLSECNYPMDISKQSIR